MTVDLSAAALQASDDVQLGIWAIPHDVWTYIYEWALSHGQLSDPFVAGNSCWKLALYLGIASVESGSSFYMGIEGDAADDAFSGPAGTCCSYYHCLTDISCSSYGYSTAWEAARAHAPYGAAGAYLSHGIYQLYVCGQGANYACRPARLHELALHMSIALDAISTSITSYWSDSNIEQSCRTCTQYAGHPGAVGDYDYRVTNIWNATVYVETFLYNFLLGYDPGPEPPPPIPTFPESPMPPFPVAAGPLGPSPLPPFP